MHFCLCDILTLSHPKHRLATLFLLHILTIPLTWGLYLFRHKIPFMPRLLLYVGGWSCAALAGALQWGLLGTWPLALMIVPILITLFYSRRWGLIVTLLVSLSILPIGFLFSRGTLELDFDPRIYMEHPSSWLFLILNYLAVPLAWFTL
jgi:hypothetical protein